MNQIPGTYKTLWGATEQPTTLFASFGTIMVGNYITFNTNGNLVGMRWGRRRNWSDTGVVGIVTKLGALGEALALCKSAPHAAVLPADLEWVNMFIHPFLHINAGETYMLAVITNLSYYSYNDAALSAADVTIGDWTYPKDGTGGKPNGASSTGCRIAPTTAANGRRFAVDVLWLPD